MAKFTAAIVGAGRMAGTIDDEVTNYPAMILPYSHAAGYAAIPEVELVAFADVEEDKAKSLAERYGVRAAYTDYREMIEQEQPEIVSIATPCTAHAEITIFAAEHGVLGIYCEKGMACSLAEADAMVEAVERSGAKFNMGTLRRWHPGVDKARELIAAGEIGQMTTIVSYSLGSLLHSGSHYIDLLLNLAGDPGVEWVQGTVLHDDFDPEAPTSEVDLSASASIRFGNGIFAHALSTPLVAEVEVIGTEGAIRAHNNCLRWYLRRSDALPGPKPHKEHNIRQFPHFERVSPTVGCIRDLMQAMETDGETSAHVRLARLNTEVAFAVIESHRRGGARVSVPLANRGFWMRSR